jgi:hypothetical protein
MDAYIAGKNETMSRAAALIGLYPIVTFQYCSTTLYQFSYQIQ